MRALLTAAFIQSATAEPGKDRTVFWDTTLPGFGLMVTKSGARSYVCQYRNANGQSKRLTIDSKLALADARREAKKRMGEVAKGGDPLAERRKAIAATKVAVSGTLAFVAGEYCKREGRKIRTMAEREATFERAILPKLGKQQIGEIRRVDIVRLLDHIEDERGPVAADKALAFLSRLFSWHAARSDDFRSPLVRGMARTKPRDRARERILSDDEIRAIWKAAEKQRGPFASLVQFLLLTAARRNEAARATRYEITGNEWLIPAERHKSKREFLLPLSGAALAVLAAIPVIGKRGGYIFTTDGENPISGFSKFKKALEAASGVSSWTPHDLRRTARTLMSRAGVAPDIAERCLGHVIPGVRATYDRHRFANEKRTAFELLAKEIRRILSA
jgi:integrase